MGRAKKILAVTGIVLGVIVVAAGIGLYFLSQPKDLVPYSEITSASAKSRNTDVTRALLLVGLDSALVDVTAERVYVAYKLSANSTNASAPSGDAAFDAAASTLSESSAMQRLVAITAGAAAPEAAKVTVLQYVGETPSVFWVVANADVEAFAKGALSLDGFMEKVNVTTF